MKFIVKWLEGLSEVIIQEIILLENFHSSSIVAFANRIFSAFPNKSGIIKHQENRKSDVQIYGCKVYM